MPCIWQATHIINNSVSTILNFWALNFQTCYFYNYWHHWKFTNWLTTLCNNIMWSFMKIVRGYLKIMPLNKLRHSFWTTQYKQLPNFWCHDITTFLRPQNIEVVLSAISIHGYPFCQNRKDQFPFPSMVFFLFQVAFALNLPKNEQRNLQMMCKFIILDCPQTEQVHNIWNYNKQFCKMRNSGSASNPSNLLKMHYYAEGKDAALNIRAHFQVWNLNERDWWTGVLDNVPLYNKHVITFWWSNINNLGY